MPNETERIQLELGRNERWQDKAKEGLSSMPLQNAYTSATGKPMKRQSRVSTTDRQMITQARRRLNQKE